VEIVGLEPRRNDLARGIVIARSAQPLDATTQKALWDALATAGITERADDDTAEEPTRAWHAAPWLPPTDAEIAGQRDALEHVAPRFGLDVIWFVKIETGVDGVMWLEMMSDTGEGEEVRDDDETEAAAPEAPSEVLYAAPDAPQSEHEASVEDDVVTEDEPEEDFEVILESHWRNGGPPIEHTVPFPIEHYPEIVDDYDWEAFGIALKLGGPDLAGEESVVNAFFALWLSVYQDERSEDFEPFARADVVHDRRHRSALMWVERFAVPATAADQVHFLLWIIARLHEILPITWARFEDVDETVKGLASENTSTHQSAFVLAGNPLADRFRRHGEEAALTWAVSQTTWSRRELCGMLVELAVEHDPDDPAAGAVAERLLRRAIAWDPRSNAPAFLAIILIRQHRAPEAFVVARGAPDPDVRLQCIAQCAQRERDFLAESLELLDPETARAISVEELAALTSQLAKHAPAQLPALLARLPDDVALVPHLYNASFAVERPQALAILQRVLSLPEPARGSGEGRTALVMAWNNASIHAHALGEYRLAVDLANGGQRYASENPYIYHSAACAYAAVGELDRAIEQVSRAIELDYEHTEKMETDSDLAPLQLDPRFVSLFNEWRTRRADLN
jgi:tetratricopeptide (TPR) repeat protein